MINPKELRIDNLIFDHEGQIRRVAYVGETIGGDITYLKPIPLTPEILERTGFKIVGERYRVNETFSELHIHENIGSEIFDFYKAGCGKISEVTHLHQLQNLYFALTGEELEVSLPLA